MKNKLSLLIIISVLFYSIINLLHADDNNAVSETFLKAYERLTVATIKNFKQTAETLVKIPNPDHKQPDWKIIRSLKTRLLLQLLEQIDRARDLSFDFNNTNNLPYSNIEVPGYSYPAGIAPSAIKEPEIRKAYEEALRRNLEKSLRFDLELQLDRYDRERTDHTVRYLQLAYDKTPEDVKELKDYLNIVTDAKHNAELKKRLIN